MIGRVFKRIYKNKKGEVKTARFYSISFPFRGRERIESTGLTDEKAAKAVLMDRLAVVLGGSYAPGANRWTYADMLELMRQDYILQGHRSWHDVVGKTPPLTSFFELILVKDINAPLINSYKSRRVQEGAARATINGELRYLRRMLNLSVEAMKLTAAPRIKLLPEENRRDGFIDPGDFEALLTKIRDEDVRDLVDFLYQTGWRLQAGVNLEWNSVNDTRNSVTMTSALSKNKTPLELPINAKLGAILERRRKKRIITDAASERGGVELRKQSPVETCEALIRENRSAAAPVVKGRTFGLSPDAKICPLVFHRNGRKIKDFRDCWERATEAAGFRGLLVHDLCRSAARNLARAGVSETVASKYLNRKTLSIYKLYRIVDREDLRLAGEALDREQSTVRKVEKI
jgi:hypothetical protein